LLTISISETRPIDSQIQDPAVIDHLATGAAIIGPARPMISDSFEGVSAIGEKHAS